MAKIPRVEMGNRPSAVPGGAIYENSTGEMLSKAAGAVAGAGYEIAADMEERESKAQRFALAEKKKLTDEVRFAKVSNDFLAASQELENADQQANWDDPEKYPEIRAKKLKELGEQFVKANPDIALDLVKFVGAHSRSEFSKAQDWKQIRTTQIAKTDAELLARQFASDASIPGKIRSTEELETYIRQDGERLKGLFTRVLGPKGGAEIWEKMNRDTVKAYTRTVIDRNPWEAVELLEGKSGPVFDNLDGDEVKSLIGEARASVAGAPTRMLFDVVSKTARDNRDLTTAFMKGDLDGQTLFAKKSANDQQRRLMKTNPLFLRQTKEQQNEQLEFFAARDKTIDALLNIRLRSIPADISDDVPTHRSLQQRYDELFKDKKKRSRDLVEAVRFQTDLAAARADGKISKGTFDTWKRALDLSIPDAALEETRNVGGTFTSLEKVENVERGNYQLNQKFKLKFRGQPDDVKLASRTRFLKMYLEASNDGKLRLANEVIDQMVDSAISLETETPLERK